MEDLLDRSDAVGIAEAIRRGDAEPVELVEAAADRIEDRDGEINAVIARRFEQAVAEASEIPRDAPLAGVPFLVKDLDTDVAGLPSTNGSRLFADAVAGEDSELVSRYRRTGLVVLGKTNTPEFGKNASTEPALFGPTRNPRDHGRSVGGSSGGTAAAIAAGMVPIGHGSDGGGSIRIPASACGLVGLKPSRGRMPGRRQGGALSGPMSVDHVLTRSLRDTALLLDLTAGPEQGAGIAAPATGGRYADEVGADPGRCRVALQVDRFDGVAASAQVTGPVRAAAERLAAVGHEVTETELTLPATDMATAFAVALSLPTVVDIEDRLAELGRELADGDVEPFTRMLFDHGRSLRGPDALRGWRALERVGRHVGAFFAGHDLLVTPTIAEPVPPLGWLDTADPTAMYERAGTYSSFTGVCNATGQPAVSLPLGHDDGGMPVGVQLIAAYGREDLLLRVASQLLDEGSTRTP